MNLKAIIVEDEIESQISLQNMLTNFCTGITVVNIVDRINKAVKAIQKEQPDLVFLDIQLPVEDGFELFNYFPNPNFQVIFTSAYNHFASKAFKLSAIDYLLKPIDLDELRNAVNSAKDRKLLHTTHQKLSILKENLNSVYEKLVLPTQDGFSFVEIKDIIYCEAQGNYTLFHLIDKEKIIVSKTLKIYAAILEDLSFFRISRSHLININHIKKYGKQKCPTVTMRNGSTVSVSVNRRVAFLEYLTLFR